MTNNSFKSAKRVLVFNGAKKYVATASSVQELSKLTNARIAPQAISFACSGKYIAAGGYYLRYENENVLVEKSDENKLTVEEFDRLCGEERQYHDKQRMSRMIKANATRNKNTKRKKRK